MTRDEAIEKAQTAWMSECNCGPALVAALENLGLLKFDKPKSAERLAEEALLAKFSGNDIALFLDTLQAANLRVVPAC